MSILRIMENMHNIYFSPDVHECVWSGVRWAAQCTSGALSAAVIAANFRDYISSTKMMLNYLSIFLFAASLLLHPLPSHRLPSLPFPSPLTLFFILCLLIFYVFSVKYAHIFAFCTDIKINWVYFSCSFFCCFS